MKKIVLFLVIAFSTIACKEYEDIQFLGLKDVKVNGIKNGKLLIRTNAAFHNPNDAKGKLKSANIYVLYQGDTLAHVTHIEKLVVGANTNFEVPLSLEISMNKLQKGLLSNLASLLRKKSVELEFKGNIKVASFGFAQTIPISYKEQIEF
ncbi:MAG: LEA type 2 family protein [Cyclobacteriaceae bacterium]|nr:LEA type 2 family protein [Cyclobacteriaceae bacterium]